MDHKCFKYEDYKKGNVFFFKTRKTTALTCWRFMGDDSFINGLNAKMTLPSEHQYHTRQTQVSNLNVAKSTAKLQKSLLTIQQWIFKSRLKTETHPNGSNIFRSSGIKASFSVMHLRQKTKKQKKNKTIRKAVRRVRQTKSDASHCLPQSHQAWEQKQGDYIKRL